MRRGGAGGHPRRRAIADGDVLSAPPARDHRGIVGPAGSQAILLTPGPDRDPAFRAAGLSGFRRFRGSELGWLTARLKREFRARDRAANVTLEGAVLDLLGRLGREEAFGDNGKPRWAARVRERLDAQFADPPSLSALVAEANVSRSHLQRTFRRCFGVSIGVYVRRRRLERAAALLVGNQEAISMISVACGFYDQSHFTAAFRRRFGMTPAQYRRQCRSEDA